MITVCLNLLDNGRKAVKEKMQTKSAEAQIERRYYEQPEDIVEKGHMELRGCCTQKGLHNSIVLCIFQVIFRNYQEICLRGLYLFLRSRFACKDIFSTKEKFACE